MLSSGIVEEFSLDAFKLTTQMSTMKIPNHYGIILEVGLMRAQ